MEQYSLGVFMQTTYNPMIAILISALCVMATISAQAQEKKIAIKDLPAAVTAAFQQIYPKATITGAATEMEDGKSMYEVESKDGTINRDLLFTEKGEVYEIEESMSPESLPTDIKSALQKQFTKYKLIKAEKITHGAKVEYELKVKSHKKTYAVVLDSSAKIVRSDVMKTKKEHKENKEKEERDEKDEK
jgi:hypothetical protein